MLRRNELVVRSLEGTRQRRGRGLTAATAPSAANVRLAVFLGGTGSPSAHVKIFVCDRDQA
jgi:hypothetical protein